jgi:hypothetical protein
MAISDPEFVKADPSKVSPAVRQMHPEALRIFRDAYTVEFLGLPPTHCGSRPALWSVSFLGL